MLHEMPIVTPGREGRKQFGRHRTVLKGVNGFARDKNDVTGGDGKRVVCDGVGQVAFEDIELLVRFLMKMRSRPGSRPYEQFHRAITAARFFTRDDERELGSRVPIGRSSPGWHMDKCLRHLTPSHAAAIMQA